MPIKENKQGIREFQYKEKIYENKKSISIFIKEYINCLQFKFVSEHTDIGSDGYSFELSS